MFRLYFIDQILTMTPNQRMLKQGRHTVTEIITRSITKCCIQTRVHVCRPMYARMLINSHSHAKHTHTHTHTQAHTFSHTWAQILKHAFNSD